MKKSLYSIIFTVVLFFQIASDITGMKREIPDPLAEAQCLHEPLIQQRKMTEDQIPNGQPTFPIPFDNDLKMTCCQQNAIVQCLLQCPKFCLFLDNMKEPKNELELHLKRLRENLKQFSYNRSHLLDFLNAPFFNPIDYELWQRITGCSRCSCLGIRNYMNSSCIDEIQEMRFPTINCLFIFEYLLMKKIFGAEFVAFYYLHGQKTLFSLRNIKFLPENGAYQYFLGDSKRVLDDFNDHGLDFIFIHIPSIDLFVVTPNPDRVADLLELVSNKVDFLYDTIIALEAFFTKDTGKIYKLKAVDFSISRSLRFGIKPECSDEISKKIFEDGSVWAEGRLSEFVETVREAASNIPGHCVAYLNYKDQIGGDAWYFCDDFFRACLNRPLIRKIPGNTRNMIADLIREERETDPVLFFSTDNII